MAIALDYKKICDYYNKFMEFQITLHSKVIYEERRCQESATLTTGQTKMYKVQLTADIFIWYDG